MEEVWIVSAMFLFNFTAIWVIAYYVHHTKTKRYEAIVKIAECSGEINPELLSMLGRDEGANSRATSDMRKGLIWIAIGVPIMLAFLSQGELVGVSLGAAPVLVGLAYLAVMKFGYKDEKPIDSH